MTLLYQDAVFLEHNTGRHPERAERLRAIYQHLDQVGLAASCARRDWQPASDQQLERIHAASYLRELRRFIGAGGGRVEVDTVVSARSFDAAACAAGAVCDAVERVVSGHDTSALCLVRPPGHHALRDRPMGFCLVNNVAVGAIVATETLGLDRVLIVDWDVHHGNGTQDAFWESEQVGFLSIHRWPFYPGTGSRDETGTGRGLGTTLNLPIEFGTPRSEYLRIFTENLAEFANRMRPELVLISAGFDSHHLDPIGSLGLEVEDFAFLTRTVLEVARQHCRGRVVSVLEGGYNVQILPICLEAHLRELLAG